MNKSKMKKKWKKKKKKNTERRVYVWNKRSSCEILLALFICVYVCTCMLVFLSLPAYTRLECAFTQLTSLPLLVFLFSRPSSFTPPRFPSLFAGPRRSFCFASSRIGPRIVSRVEYRVSSSSLRAPQTGTHRVAEESLRMALYFHDSFIVPSICHIF